MDLERRDEKLEEMQAQGLHSFDRRDFPVELEELHERVAGVESELAAEAVPLSRSVMGIFDALVNLGTFPIWDIPESPKSVHDVLTAAGLVMEHLLEEHDSSASSCV
jgi:hypothetical protein